MRIKWDPRGIYVPPRRPWWWRLAPPPARRRRAERDYLEWMAGRDG